MGMGNKLKPEMHVFPYAHSLKVIFIQILIIFCAFCASHDMRSCVEFSTYVVMPACKKKITVFETLGISEFWLRDARPQLSNCFHSYCSCLAFNRISEHCYMITLWLHVSCFLFAVSGSDPQNGMLEGPRRHCFLIQPSGGHT